MPPAQALHSLVQCETPPSVAHFGNSSSRQTCAARVHCQSRVPITPVCNPPNKTKTGVKQEPVLACVRLRLILERPVCHVPTVLHTSFLPVVDAQVPIINSCNHFVSITRIMSACSLWLQLPFQFFQNPFPSPPPGQTCFRGKLVCGFCASLSLFELHHCLQHIWCIWTHQQVFGDQ